MKKNLLSIMLALFVLASCSAGGEGDSNTTNPIEPTDPTDPIGKAWQQVGGAVSTGSVKYTSLVIYNNIPYLAYQDDVDAAGGGKAVVKKFDGRNWKAVGGTVSSGRTHWTSLAVDNNGILYVAYQDGDGGVEPNKAVVKKFINNAWVGVGEAVSAGGTQYTSLVVYNNTPFVAYQDNSIGGKAVVKKFINNAWVGVDDATGVVSAGSAEHTSLAVDKNGTPYLGYRDYSDKTGPPVVKKFNGSSWVDTGLVNYGSANFTFLAIDNNNTPYLAYVDASQGSKAIVKKFNGSSWEGVGRTHGIVGDEYVEHVSLTTYNNIPYVAYNDKDGKAVVKMFVDNAWVGVGSDTGEVSVGNALWTFLTIHNGIIYLAYQDVNNGNKAVVMKYDVVR